MTENQLIYFIAIVDLGSYNNAALELNISQSSISKQIILLEDELGVKLFNRQYHHIQLTPAGKKLLPQAKMIIDNIQNMKKTAQQMHPHYIQKISILVLPIIGHFKLYASLNEFYQKNNEYTVEFIELEEPELYKRILSGNFDMAMTYYDNDYFTGNHIFKPTIDDEIVIAVNKEHSLAKRDYLLPTDLMNEPLLMMEKYTCLNHLSNHYLRQYAITPSQVTYGRPETILGGAQAHCGLALVSKTQALYYINQNIKLIPLKPSLNIQLGLYINKNEINNPVINNLLHIFSKKQ